MSRSLKYWDKWIKIIAPIGELFGLIPSVQVFTTKDLEHSLIDAGFKIDYKWQPGKGKALFVVAQKAG
jgi:hypothetical protein